MLSFRQLFDHSIEVGGLHEVDELLLGIHVELGVDMVGVRVHRSRGYEQLFLDARGRPAKRKQVEHVDLPFRQAVICADDLAALEQRLFSGFPLGEDIAFGRFVRTFVVLLHAPCDAFPALPNGDLRPCILCVAGTLPRSGSNLGGLHLARRRRGRVLRAFPVQFGIVQIKVVLR